MKWLKIGWREIIKIIMFLVEQLYNSSNKQSNGKN